LKILSWILLPPIGLVVIAFAIANRHDVVISLDPLPLEFSLPLYAVVFAGIFVGLLAGGIAAWMRGARWRQEARRQRRRASRLEGEVAARTTEAESAAASDRPRIENAA
jgi:uncharacterized integral membrane protein